MLSQGGMPGYTTAKSAVAGLTKTLARDLGEYNIRVNCVVPGWILTERQKNLWLTAEAEEEQLKRQCLKRVLVPEDIAKVVLFFHRIKAQDVPLKIISLMVERYDL